MKILEKDLQAYSIVEDGKVDAPLLLLGLTYREVSRCLEAELDAPTKAPDYLVNSDLGVKEVEKIERLMNSLDLDSD